MGDDGLSDIRLSAGPLTRPAEIAARDALVQTVFGGHRPTRGWRSFVLFDESETCVGTLDAAILPCLVGGEPRMVGAVGSVCVHPDWRGRGLSRPLIEAALAWCDAQTRAVLLFTAEPAIYRRYGFRSVPQHAFVGAPPPGAIGYGVEKLEAQRDRARIESLVRRRTAVSRRHSLFVDPSVFLDNLERDRDLELAVIPERDALVVFQFSDEVLTIVDIVAARMPRLADVIGALNVRARLLALLFAPDQVHWRAEPRPDDTGLMIRGDAALVPTEPFMIPPTAEF